MKIRKHIYSFGYDNTESELCKLESRCVFDKEEKDRILCTDVKVEPSSSAFIKNRLDIISASTDYSRIIDQIKQERIAIEGFKIEYMVFDGDQTSYADRLDKLRDIGYRIEGIPDYYNPIKTFALCYFEGFWCFGTLIKNEFAWHKHNQKPCSYSNSISINIAKSLVNIAAKGDREKKLLDACCGVGTIMLEACFAGFDVEGCDINWKICENARKNLAFFNYRANVYRSDIRNISERYDAAIIDLPYNLLSTVSEDDVLNILESSARIADRLVIVSTSDIAHLINNMGFSISDHCTVSKKGKTKFARRIWVCDIGSKLGPGNLILGG